MDVVPSSHPVRRARCAGHSRRLLSAGLVAALALGGCSGNGGPTSANSSASAPATTTTVAASYVAGASTTNTSLDQPATIQVKVPVVTTARNLTQAIEVLRERTLREATWDSATKVTMTGAFVSSTTDVLGVRIDTTMTTKSGTHDSTTTLWYDATMSQTVSASALVSWSGWKAFSQEVSRAARAAGLDADKATKALQAPQAPWGSGPGMAFDSKGDLLVIFPAGSIDASRRIVRIAADTVSPLLSGLGQKALGASLHPTPFTGTPSTTTTWFTKLRKSPQASDSPNTRPLPGDAQAPKGSAPAHPSTAIGVDCIATKCVALTYDDGPASTTDQVRDSLVKAKATATFFVLGSNVDNHPDMPGLLAGSGFEIGSHSASNTTLTTLGPQGRKREITDAAASLAKVTGRSPLLYRPPYGVHNRTVDTMMRQDGLAMVNWTADSQDWKTRNANKIVSDVTEFATTYTQPIIVLHDIYTDTAAATDDLISSLRKAGFTLVTVSELTVNTGGMEAGKAYCRGTAVNQSGYQCGD